MNSYEKNHNTIPKLIEMFEKVFTSNNFTFCIEFRRT